ncbi:conjugal transfer protein TraL [Stenotrophomonas sp. GD03993]|uniref:nucleotide-binding protein n=1 Tax=unclassified Stenotrophomonas TaxID=196198 RepID=UPI0024468E4B|nr:MULTISPECIES: conjugal transfer protein TraL [unclassified Stenotrophomonas]MDH0187691.1 conjugal transfer protein TraL [Stenotrophomonas sp. GD04051]MDH0465285.1 conjugal transfer protein TraL [Stenotrophomonas sp. GD03993]MDH0877870.1 conjugal transfer protein TraL [Stenotrophomonas sp. GD03877]
MNAIVNSNQPSSTDLSLIVHFILQGKGGVGKTVAAAFLAQHQNDAGKRQGLVDTDPVNATFCGYKALGAERVELMEDGTLNERRFDQVIERILSEEQSFVIDNGASSFIPLSSYLLENDVIQLLLESGRRVMIHTVITGGQAMLDTLNGFKTLASQLPEGAELIVWLNEFFGPIEADGKSFEEMKVYKEYKDKVKGLVTIHRQTGATFGTDVQLMLENKLTFEEVATSGQFGLMAQQRLKTVRKSIWQQLDLIY